MEHIRRKSLNRRWTIRPDDADVRAVGPASGASADSAEKSQQVVNAKQPLNHVEGEGHNKTDVSHRSDRTLYEILDDFAEKIPQEIIGQVPDDFIENMDHYLHGAGKRWPPSS